MMIVMPISALLLLLLRILLGFASRIMYLLDLRLDQQRSWHWRLS